MFRPQEDVGPVIFAASTNINGFARLRVDDGVVFVDNPLLVPSAVLVPQVNVGPVGIASSRDIQNFARMWVGDATIRK